MQQIDPFIFSKRLRASSQFTPEQADALAEALMEALQAPEPEPELDLPDWVPPKLISTHNKTTAAIFAIFLGGLGLHRFYLGRPGSGLLYLVFCWTFIPALAGFVEGLRLFSMGNDEFARTYG